MKHKYIFRIMHFKNEVYDSNEFQIIKMTAHFIKSKQLVGTVKILLMLKFLERNWFTWLVK